MITRPYIECAIPVPQGRACAACESAFQPVHGNEKWCSHACQQQGTWARKRRESKRYALRRALMRGDS